MKGLIKHSIVYGAPIADIHTGGLVALTSKDIASYVILDITVGGWVTIFLALSAVLAFSYNAYKLYKIIKGNKNKCETKESVLDQSQLD